MNIKIERDKEGDRGNFLTLKFKVFESLKFGFGLVLGGVLAAVFIAMILTIITGLGIGFLSDSFNFLN